VSSLARRAAVPVVLVLALVALLSACTPLNDQEKYLFGSINQARASARLKPVYEFEPLTAKARAWAQTLAAQGQLTHSNLQALGVGWTAAAENVGRSSSIEDVVSRLMASPEHRANILDPRYGLVGLGTARAKDGTVYAVEVFIG
jgi:uncharacterized protein YkwD